jgi:uncharacterized SAM-binding protein YcdF (DUF218 family)
MSDEPAIAPPGRSPWRALRWVLAGVLVAVLVLALIALPLTVFPESVAVPSEADVVIVLAGGGGERLVTATGLMERVVGPPAGLLLISDGSGRSDGGALCGTAAEAYAVACFEPSENSTAGEARTIGELAAAQGWERIALVTSTYHATRARLRVARCTDARVQVVVAAPDLSVWEQVRVSAREMTALARDALDAGEC